MIRTPVEDSRPGICSLLYVDAMNCCKIEHDIFVSGKIAMRQVVTIRLRSPLTVNPIFLEA